MNTADPGARVVVCQLGARMHYAVPRFLFEAGCLERLHTDLYASRPIARLVQRLPGALVPSMLKRLAGREGALPGRLVRSYPWFGLQYYWRTARAADSREVIGAFVWGARQFGRRVVRHGFGGAGAVYTFNTAALEILQAARDRGLRTIVEQTIAPRAVEEELLRQAHARHPGWEPAPEPIEAVQVMADREAKEWALADVIVCGSTFVRDGVEKSGGPVARCAVVPYGVLMHGHTKVCEARADRPLRVLSVGTVSLRKGAPAVLAVAKALTGRAEFRWVGPVQVTETAAARLSAHVELTGAIPRMDVRRHYEWADVFFLPSICEGSATVTYEAMSWGLPVVTTPGAGSPVRDGIDGYVVDAADTDAMTDRISAFVDDRERLASMTGQVRAGAPRLSLDAYKARLLPLLCSGTH